MGANEAVVRIIIGLAWPVAVVLVAALLQGELRKLIRAISRAIDRLFRLRVKDIIEVDLALNSWYEVLADPEFGADEIE